MNTGKDVRGIIDAEIRRVLENSGRTHGLFNDTDLLFEGLGLDSLDLAQIVVVLEQQLGYDPFRTPGRRIRTFGELVQAYFQAAT